MSPALKNRQRAAGFALYDALGIARRDVAARRANFDRNYRFFDAPVGIVVTIDRDMGKGCFMDLGLSLMALFLAAEAEGLGSSGIGALANYASVVHGHLGLPADEMVVCGVALGVGGHGGTGEPVSHRACAAGQTSQVFAVLIQQNSAADAACRRDRRKSRAAFAAQLMEQSHRQNRPRGPDGMPARQGPALSVDDVGRDVCALLAGDGLHRKGLHDFRGGQIIRGQPRAAKNRVDGRHRCQPGPEWITAQGHPARKAHRIDTVLPPMPPRPSQQSPRHRRRRPYWRR